MEDVTVNGKHMVKTRTGIGAKLFYDNLLSIRRFAKELSGSNLFQLSWDDSSHSNVSISCVKDCAVIVAIWENLKYEDITRQSDLINILQSEGWILRSGLQIQGQNSWTTLDNGKTIGIMSKTLQAGHKLSFNRHENDLPISVY